MAMETILNDKKLKILLDTGTVDGKETTKKISFPVRFEATDSNIHLTGLALASLTDFNVIEIFKDEESILKDE